VNKKKVEINDLEKTVLVRTIKAGTFTQTFIRIADVPVADDLEIDTYNAEDCMVDVDQHGNVLGVTVTLWHGEEVHDDNDSSTTPIEGTTTDSPVVPG